MTIPAPTRDATTFVGQLQWFIYGFGYASIIASVALMIRLFKSASSGRTNNPFDV